jgi:hypothetical protein
MSALTGNACVPSAAIHVLQPKAGAATAEEVEAFLGDQLRASEEGTFFAG